MKLIFDYFTPKIELSLLESLKTKAFIVFNFILFFLLVLLIIQAIFIPSGDDNLTYTLVPVLGIFVGANLFILKKFGIKIAGNTLSLGIVIVAAMALNTLKPEVSDYTKNKGITIDLSENKDDSDFEQF